MSDGWRWKVEDQGQNPDLDLRYEPGTWGDLIKGAWAEVVARALAARGPFTYLDPFAGAPDYPLVDAARARVAALPAEVDALRTALTRFVDAGRFPSTARLVLDAGDVEARVFEIDPARRAKWDAHADATVLEVESGDDALGGGNVGGAAPRKPHGSDLLLLDPYDLFERWEALFPPALQSGRVVLAYLFNKAPRSPVAFKRYRDLRAGLELGQRGMLVGRMPSDAVLPRAWHEVLLVAPRDLLAQTRDELRTISEALTRALVLPGAFEEVGEA